MLTEKDLSTFLTERGIPHEILDPGQPTPTCEAAAQALRVDVSRIIKSVLFVTDDGHRALCILQGDQRADLQKLTSATGTPEWRLAKPPEVLAHTGYPIGAVPPFTIPPHDPPVLVDPRAAHPPEVIGGGGASHLLLRAPTSAILELNHARVLDLSKT